MKAAQFWVRSVIWPMFTAGTPAAAPGDSTAPAACVSFRPDAMVPLPWEMALAAPSVTEVITKAARCAS
ncbi:hypothetical protein D3C72_2536330 [compost metagenome]